MEYLARLYKALAHPVRLRMLHILCQQEACVCHLTCVMRRPQPYISQQLSVLRDAGLVIDRRDGQVVYYRAADPAVVDILELGQRILRGQGAECELPAVCMTAVPGCPCPKCNEGREQP